MVVEGHRGYGDPPDIRRPAQEYYMLPNQNPMAVDGNDDMVRPRGARDTIRPRVGRTHVSHRTQPRRS